MIKIGMIVKQHGDEPKDFYVVAAEEYHVELKNSWDIATILDIRYSLY